MANNVLFKKGLQASLPSSGITENAFYLTTDTHRLYAGVDSTHVALLNSAVAFYDTLANLQAATKQFKPAPGDVAYVRKQGELVVNALMLYVDDSTKWVQINSQNANTYFQVTDAQFSKEVDSDPSSISYKLTITQTDQNGTTSSIVSNTFTIDADDLHDTMSASATDSNKNAIIKLDNTTDNGVKLIAGTNVTLTTTGKDNAPDEINIAAKDTTYTLGVTEGAAQVKLTDGAGTVSGTANFIGDSDWINVSNEDGKIKISHNSKSIDTPAASDGGKLVDESTFTVITGITADDNNHITEIQKTTYTIQDTKYTVDASVDNSTKNLVVTLKDENGSNAHSDSIDISSTVVVNGTDYIIKPTGSITLPEYYTKTEIDSKHKAINAMVYKGVVNSNSDLPTTGVSIGWTYKVGTKGTYGGIECNVGDLLIANGTAESDQNIITAGLTWDHIDTSDKEDTLYTLSVANNVVTLTDSVNGGEQSFTIDGGNKLTASTSGNIITINHDSITAPTTKGSAADVSGYGKAFTAITELAEDGYGHVTGITTKKVTLPNADTVEADKTNVKLTFKDGNGTIQGGLDLNVEENGPIVITGASTDNKNLTATIKHGTITKNDTTGEAKPGREGTFNVVESVTYNNYGHVSGVKTTTVTLPKIAYSIDGPVAVTNGFKYELKDEAGNLCGDSIAITSTSLTTTAAGTIDITWGSF